MARSNFHQLWDAACRVHRVKRKNVLPNIAANILFLSDRTCCICREKGKPVQIHHIDSNKFNNEIKNLAVLCFDCHNDTQVTGGFHRKLDADQIVLYRDNWLLLVSRERTTKILSSEEASLSSSLDLGLVTTLLDTLKEKKEYELLSVHYDIIGNAELRDKYIDLALSQEKSIATEIFLRALQDKIELVDPNKIKKEINRRKRNGDWCQLARLFVDIKDCDQAALYYCKSICESLQKGNVFSAAYYLKEMNQGKLHIPLFEKAYGEYSDKQDLWWQVRSLQELGWNSELETLILSKRAEIEQSGDLLLLELLYKITGEREKLIEVSGRVTHGLINISKMLTK